MSVKEYFPGANTPDGFFSYYSDILKSSEAKNIVILKGGPGTGKSSIMKKTAAHAANKGYSVELLHCSSDPASLDGVCIREKGFLIVDGTSPHIIDPRYPGAVDEIINLGSFWRSDEIRPHKNEIQKLTAEISQSFKRAYSFMSAAHSVMNQIKSDVKTDAGYVCPDAEEILKELGISKTNRKGKVRRGFLSANTHLGKISYAHSFVNDARHVIYIAPDIGGEWSEYMRKFADVLICSGLDIRIFYNSMNPDSEIEHIYAEDKSLFVTTEHPGKTCDRIIDLNKSCRCLLYPEYESDKQAYNILMQKTTDALKKAKALHDELEKHYIPHMNFDMMDAELNLILKKLD